MLVQATFGQSFDCAMSEGLQGLWNGQQCLLELHAIRELVSGFERHAEISFRFRNLGVLVRYKLM